MHHHFANIDRRYYDDMREEEDVNYHNQHIVNAYEIKQDKISKMCIVLIVGNNKKNVTKFCNMLNMNSNDRNVLILHPTYYLEFFNSSYGNKLKAAIDNIKNSLRESRDFHIIIDNFVPEYVNILFNTLHILDLKITHFICQEKIYKKNYRNVYKNVFVYKKLNNKFLNSIEYIRCQEYLKQKDHDILNVPNNVNTPEFCFIEIIPESDEYIWIFNNFVKEEKRNAFGIKSSKDMFGIFRSNNSYYLLNFENSRIYTIPRDKKIRRGAVFILKKDEKVKDGIAFLFKNAYTPNGIKLNCNLHLKNDSMIIS